MNGDELFLNLSKAECGVVGEEVKGWGMEGGSGNGGGDDYRADIDMLVAVWI